MLDPIYEQLVAEEKARGKFYLRLFMWGYIVIFALYLVWESFFQGLPMKYLSYIALVGAFGGVCLSFLVKSSLKKSLRAKQEMYEKLSSQKR